MREVRSRRPLRLRAVMLAAGLALAAPACGPALTPAVTLRLNAAAGAPADATVTIDEQYVGSLRAVATRGLRLPVGQHRITVEKSGYFPWDRLVDADRAPVTLEVTLDKIPE